MATVSQFAAPRDGEASLWSACGSSPLDLPATKLATVSQFAAPRDGEASFWFSDDTTPLGLPGAHESGDSSGARSPQGERGLFLIWVRRHSAGPPSSLRNWQQFPSSQALRDAEV